MSTIKEMILEERPRERLWEQGANSLRTAELLAILLRTGMAGKSALAIGDELLEKYGGLGQLCRVNVNELAKLKGIGPAKAVQLKAAFELGARFSKVRALECPIEAPEDVELLLGDEMRQCSHECIKVLALNTRLNVLAIEEISRGTINETVAHPRDVIRVGITHEAYGILMVHNHPSGDPSPSQADYEFTVRVKEAAHLMQIHLMDHVILGAEAKGREGYYSFKQAGYL